MLAGALLAVLSAGLEVRAEPSALRLDLQVSAELTFRAPPGVLAVECSAGEVDQLHETAPGEWHAIWRAPASLIPQVALIAARTGESVGYFALPLTGGGDAEVRTRPGAVVSVSIGARTFGPILAGPDGKALVPVVVPPGVDFAQQGSRLIDLHVPRTRTIQLAPLPAEIAVDRDREVEIAVAAVTRAGEPLRDEPLQLTASRGEVGGAEALAPGLYRARWRIPAGATGEAFVRATVRGDPSPSEIRVRLVPGEISSIELHALQDVAVAGGAAIDLDALALDAKGNPTDDPVDFSASSGTLSTNANGQGRYRLVLTPPREASPQLTVTATARRGGQGRIASAHVAVIRPPDGRREEVRDDTPELRRVALAIRTGFLTDGHGLHAPVLGVQGALRRQWEAVQGALALDLWWARASQSSTDPSSTLIEARDDFLVASLSASLRLPVSDRAALWAQAGAGIAAASARVRVSGQTSGDATSRGAVPALELGIGAERRMWGGVPFVEARLLRTSSFALPNLVGALTAFTVCAGYRLEML
jgi:hypothetical protein